MACSTAAHTAGSIVSALTLLEAPAPRAAPAELFANRDFVLLLAAGFAAVSPMLVWYSQEVRMYEFAALFGLLALLTQLRAIRNGTMLNWAAYILSTSALLWSHYFGVLLIVVQQLIFVAVIFQRRQNKEPVRPLALGFAYSAAILAMQLVPLVVFAHHQFQATSNAAGSPSGTYDPLSFYTLLANLGWSLWGYQPDAITTLLAAARIPAASSGDALLTGRASCAPAAAGAT